MVTGRHKAPLCFHPTLVHLKRESHIQNAMAIFPVLIQSNIYPQTLKHFCAFSGADYHHKGILQAKATGVISMKVSQSSHEKKNGGRGKERWN